MSDDRVQELLIRWNEFRQRGELVGPKELCADCPEHVEEIQKRIDEILSMEAFLGQEKRDHQTSGSQETEPGHSPMLAEARRMTTPVGGNFPGFGGGSDFLPGYELLGELGRGGMGIVYKARHIKLNRLVAIKMILSGAYAGRADIERFCREAEAVARLQHANIVQIYEIGEHHGLPYFSLEYCEGGSLAGKLEGTPMPPPEAAAIVESLAKAMDAAHKKNVIHRDLKPANVLISDERPLTGGVKQVARRPSLGLATLKITDFGLAKKLDDVGQTQSGAVMGTPSYMAPEQAVGKNTEIGPLVDVYALGAILYELLTGRPPFKATTALETMMQVIHQEPVLPSQLQPKVPRDLETIAMKCLQKPTTKRYVTAAQLAEDLRRFQRGEPILARPVGRFERTGRWCRRNPLVAGLMGAVAATLILGTTLASLFALRADANAAQAIIEKGQALANKKIAEQQRMKAEKAQSAEKQRSAELQLTLEDLKKQKKIADDNWLRAEWKIYASNIMLAQAAWQENNVALANLYLDNCRWELRGWEHDYLYSLFTSHHKALFGHKGGVLGVAFSPDGKRIVSGSADMIVKIWDATNAEDLLTLKGHAGGVTTVAFSANGRRIVSGSSDKTLKIWDATGQDLVTLSGHVAGVTSVACSVDGQRIVSSSMDKSLKVWDAIKGELLLTLNGHVDAVNSVAFSSDGQRIVSGSKDKTVKIWNAATGEELATLKGHGGPVTSVAFSPDGQRIASGSADKTLRLWDANGESLLTLTGHIAGLTSVAFSPDGVRIASSGKTIIVWDARTGQELFDLKGNAGPLSFSPDGRRIVIGARLNSMLILWDTTKIPGAMVLRGHVGPVRSIAFSPDGQRIVTASQDSTLKLWDATQAEDLVTFKGHTRWVTSVAFSPDGERIVSGSYDNTLKIWGAAGQEIATLTGHTSAVKCVAFSPDSKHIVSSSSDNTIKVWDAAATRDLHTLRGHAGHVNSVVYSPDGKLIVSGSADQTLKLWNAATGHELLTLKGHRGQVLCVAFDPDGKLLISGGSDSEIRVWEAATGKELKTLTGHTGPVTGMAFAPKGERMISGSLDSTARVWNLASGEQLLTFKRRSENAAGLAVVEPRSIVFSPDGKLIVSAIEETSVNMWLASRQSTRKRDWEPLGQILPPIKASVDIRKQDK